MPTFKDEDIGIKIKTEADTSGVEETEKSLGGLDESSSKSGKGMAALGAAGKIAAGAVAAIGVAAGGYLKTGFEFNSSVEQAQAQINAFTKDAGKTAEILKYVKTEAGKTQFSFVEMANAAAGLIPASKQSGVALEDLIKQSEILAALNPAEGLEGAAFSLREALSGDFVSIVERFNLPRQRLNQLKAEGVPAIQAIQTALSEMGIDYDLVAKQGETTAARWDQIKDKWTQLAGELTQPIFQRVSQAIGQLGNSIDVAAIKDKLVAMWEAFKNNEALNKIVDGFKIFAQTLADVLGPSVTALWNSLDQQLFPALRRLWDVVSPVLIPALQILAGVLGATIVAALYVLTNGINIVIQTFSSLANFGSRMAAPFVEAAKSIYNIFKWAFNGISDIWNKTVGSLNLKVPSWVPELGGKGWDVPDMPKFSTGVRNFEGGLAMVGDVNGRGGEVVSLPKGSDVYTNAESKRMMGGGSGVNITQNIYNDVDYAKGIETIGFRLANR